MKYGLLFLLMGWAPLPSAEIRWTRMTGQFPVESAPLVADLNGDGRAELLLLNRGGQLLLWSAEGEALGSGQDGAVAQLPKGRWTSTPAQCEGRLLAVSVEGLVVALDEKYKIVWQHALAGETTWAKTVPAMLETAAGLAACYGDSSGAVTCLNREGRVALSLKLAGRPLRVPPQAAEGELLVPAGSVLYCYDAGGRLKWRRDLGATIVTRPERFAGSIVAGTESGALFALTPQGEIRWRASVGDSMETFLGLLPRPGARPLILAAGQWGNLHAFDPDGREAWTYRYHTRARAPLVADLDGDGVPEIHLSTFTQRLQRIDARGVLTDDVRLAGLVSSTPVAVPGSGDVVVVTSSLMAFRVRPGSRVPALGTADGRSEFLNRPASVKPGELHAWATPPYGFFDPTLLSETAPEASREVAVKNLYLDEADQAAFIVASSFGASLRVRVKAETTFAGSVKLREVVLTGTVNGERAADALPELGDAGLVTLGPQSAVKIWVSVDARGAAPGVFPGRITVTPLGGEARAIELPLRVEVLKLALPKKWPLALCTWDYVPNRWFPQRTREVLDDMSRHGVMVFPREKAVPRGEVDAGGRLRLDWKALDQELAWLDGRGVILFQFVRPPLRFAAGLSETARHKAEIEYLHAFRDHLKARGRGYQDYAFYPIDEPGLDYGPNVQNLVEAGKLYREADPQIRIYTDPVPSLAWKDFERIEPLVDVWAPNMRLVTGLLAGDPRMARIMRGGKTVWSYECVSQVKSLSPLRYNRANAWRAKYFGLRGIGVWTHSTTDVDHWQAGNGVNDEYALVYPGERPVPSVRWEALRDGMEDVAAMALLEERMAAHRRAGTKRDVVTEAEKYLAAALREVLELSDLAFIESRDFLAAGDRRIWHTSKDVEMYQRHRAEMARLTRALD